MDLAAANLATSSPVLAAPALGQLHKMVAASDITGPVLGRPFFHFVDRRFRHTQGQNERGIVGGPGHSSVTGSGSRTDITGRSNRSNVAGHQPG
jgi:hypothetical protein